MAKYVKKKAARHTAGRLRLFRILYLSLRQRLYEHPPLLLPLDGQAVLEHVQGEPVGAVARDYRMDNAWREVGQSDDSRDVTHVPPDALGDLLRAAYLAVVDEPLPAAATRDCQEHSLAVVALRRRLVRRVDAPPRRGLAKDDGDDYLDVAVRQPFSSDWIHSRFPP